MLDIDQLLKEWSDEELDIALRRLPEHVAARVLEMVSSRASLQLPETVLRQAEELDSGYAVRPHLRYLSERLLQAVEDVQAGRDRKIVISMPPRMGKSRLTSEILPGWLLRQNPSWKIGLISHDQSLATLWGRSIRNTITENGDRWGLQIAGDAGAAAEWQTTEGGGITSRSIGQSITGRGFKVMIVDDPVKDFAAAHSVTQRDALWDWWTANALTRLEPPSLTIVIATRWHEDDFIGRLLSDEYAGDPAEWEVISFPAIAEEHDILGRAPGEPLLSPLVPNETPESALERWDGIRDSVGSYSWAALYQQRPAPAEGAIFDMSWFRYWTTDPSKATDDGRVVLIDPATDLHQADWLDSWDCTFTSSDNSDYVVGQRWAKLGADRYLIGQHRGRMSFTETVDIMREWARPQSLGDTGKLVHRRLVEAAANGAAVIDTLKRDISGIKGVKPVGSKVSRAHVITPEIESGHVILPHPAMPGFEWVQELLSELRNFPNDAHDDQVDAMTQALSHLRTGSAGQISVPSRRYRKIKRV